MHLKRWPVAVALVGIFVLACRDGVPPFTPPGFDYAERITFGTGEDRDPQWLAGSDTLVYHTNSNGALPGAGVLLTVPAEGGTALPLFGDVQRTTNRIFATPVVSPNGQRVAFLDFVRIDVAATCAPPTPPAMFDCNLTQPVLDSMALRVRDRNAQQPLAADPALGIKLPGVDPSFRDVSSGSYVMQTLPFQQQYRQTGALLLRPSWAPDNQRIVFSNGSALFVWRVGEASATAVAGTADGVSPAWSPNSELIAFTQLVRTDSTEITCACAQPGAGPGAPFALHRRTLYTVAAPRVVLVRADGTGRVELGEGADPAWSPDGQSLYVVRNNQIVRIAGTGGAATPIPNTQNARYPAVSRDGRRLAFSKPQLRSDYDIWVVALPQ